MRTLALLAAAAIVAVCAVASSAQDTGKFVGGYVLMTTDRNGQSIGLRELTALAANAKSLPVTRIFISFFLPTMTYEKGSNTLKGAGLNVGNSGDYGFAQLKSAITTLQAGGVEVFLSMGGWNYNCWSYMYMRYSVGGYGPNTPNYWKIQQYGGGSVDGCKADSQFCWVCEPQSENTTLGSFSIFPEVPHSSVWQQAVTYVEQGAKGNQTPEWHPDIVPGEQWTDPKTNIQVTVPGTNDFVKQNRDPYGDFVQLATDLGAAGIDLDYEEFWHADYFKFGSGPWWLPQTVYKYAAISKTLMLHIESINPSLKLSTAASAVGAWSTNWWGGNLKGVWFWVKQWYPEVIDFFSKGKNAGGINVMTYDLSDNEAFHECPDENTCTLSQQVTFYMKQYKANNVPANVGYEIGTPAYPSPKHDPSHQLPLTRSELQNIITQVQPQSAQGGFFWEMFKPAPNSTEATPTETAQAICKVVMPGSSRCSGVIPNVTHTSP
jgi:hypothetical protein